MPIDLVPFGFTATENLVYGALLELGPSSGYAVAKVLSIARANGYQALDALVAKGAAAVTGHDPRRYRAVRPKDVLARIVGQESGKLDRLERQVSEAAPEGDTPVVRIEGTRALREIATRSIVRAGRSVICVAPAEFLEGLAPAWRARAARGGGGGGGGGGETAVWSTDREPRGIAVSGVTSPQVTTGAPSDPLALLAVDDSALLARLGANPTGYWSSDPALVATVRAAITGLTTA